MIEKSFQIIESSFFCPKILDNFTYKYLKSSIGKNLNYDYSLLTYDLLIIRGV
jgi:hypothetical protein